MLQKVSVIVPSFNDEKTIGNELDKLTKIRGVNIGEIIVVDDGSTDKTAGVVTQSARKNNKIRLVQHSKNKGKGAAMKTGARAAKNDALVFVDADGQFNVSEVPKLVKGLKNADMVVGSRKFSDIPLSRRINNRAARFAVFLGTGKKVRDALSGFRAMHKRNFLDLGLKKDRYEIESEINYKALRKNMRVTYVPVTVRYGPVSKITLKQNVLISLFLIRMVLRLV